MYAVPSPSLPSRWSVCTRGLARAISSAIRPVPSGELSSTTRMSRRGSCASTCGTIWGRLTASLYVGITTRARSGTRASPFPHRRHDEPGDDDKKRYQPDHLATRESARVIAQLELSGTRTYGDSQERMVAAQHPPRFAVDAHTPVEIPVLGDEHVARLGGRRIELDSHLPGVPRSDTRARRRRGW